ncbi:MAG: hypothetical protein GQ570_13615 [Helicobacteraceae bacterium]|nr:hypothetical protein [Helicobacteraceae bacterium]
MNPIGQGPATGLEMTAMKMAEDTKEQNLDKILESTKVEPQNQAQNQMIAALTGVGSSLDIRA